MFQACNTVSCKGVKKDITTPLVEESVISISRDKYYNQLYGFWLGQCIANWTGLVTEMDKIGNIGEIKTGDFYTRENWGKPDQPNIWGQGIPSDLSPTIDFVFRDPNEIWGADDDTDIEYMYQHLLLTNETSILTPQQIRNGWIKHIKQEEENFLWVSNQKAFDLMSQGVLPPETGSPKNNEHFEMIDAQLTTEIFGLFSPARPDVALSMAHLPIQTIAREEAEYIAQFYVSMHSLASITDSNKSLSQRLYWMANQSTKFERLSDCEFQNNFGKCSKEQVDQSPLQLVYFQLMCHLHIVNVDQQLQLHLRQGQLECHDSVLMKFDSQ